MKKLPSYPNCFICGRDNMAGTNVTFLATEDGVECEYRGDPRHQGYERLVHGGVISALLDECMGWAVAVRRGRMHVTGELTIRYLKPLAIDTTVWVRASMDVNHGTAKRYSVSTGLVQDDQGNVYAKAKGTFFPIPQEYEDRVMEYLTYYDDPERVVTMRAISHVGSVVQYVEIPGGVNYRGKAK